MRDYKDLIGGAFLILFGSFAAIYALTTLRLGTLRQMGTGMLPSALGIVLILMGAGILIPALFRRGVLPSIELRPLLAVLASIAAFALLVRPFGLVPAVLGMTVIAAAADNKLTPLRAIALGACLALLAYLIFSVALGLQIPVFAWPRW